MNSGVVAYRDAVINAIRTTVTDLRDVDWYDAIFDDADLKQWTLNPPACMVAVRDVTTTMNSTGELNLGLDMVAVVVTVDTYAQRDSDLTLWSLLEQIAILVRYNNFGLTESAFQASNLRLCRLREPELRQSSTALGLVEWTAGITIGINQSVLDTTYLDASGQPVFMGTQDVEPTATFTIQNPNLSVTNDHTVAVDQAQEGNGDVL